VTVHAGRDRGGATIRLRFRRALNAGCGRAATRAGASGQRPRGHLLWPNKPARVLFWSQPRHCLGWSWPPGRGLQPVGCDRWSGVRLCWSGVSFSVGV